MSESQGTTRSDVLRGSSRLSEPKFAGLLERYIPDERVLKAGDGDLSYKGIQDGGYSKLALVLTPQRIWGFRGAGVLGAKKPVSVFLHEVEEVGRLPDIGTGKSFLGITFAAGAQMLKGGPKKGTACLIGSLRLEFDSGAVRDEWGLAVTALVRS
ncbi:MAG TPA: hypothetical protein VFL89_03140 [Solirubrobacterales bacterium]|nr:hypothetical protein [Solirubrobacterales bacterium]